jgi:hypothetical protein
MTEASVSFAGNLTEALVRYTEAGIARAMFRVAVSGRREQEASFFTGPRRRLGRRGSRASSDLGNRYPHRAIRLANQRGLPDRWVRYPWPSTPRLAANLAASSRFHSQRRSVGIRGTASPDSRSGCANGADQSDSARAWPWRPPWA